MPQPEHEKVAVEWYQRAHQDWRDAQLLAREERDSPNAIWLVQQAVEKALKSILLLHKVRFRRIHDLEELRKLIPAGFRLKAVPKDLSLLSQRGMESRYPGEYDPIGEREVRVALRLGSKVMELLAKEFDAYALRGIDPETGEPYAD
jgi:HEPN domain-containing protein